MHFSYIPKYVLFAFCSFIRIYLGIFIVTILSYLNSCLLRLCITQ